MRIFSSAEKNANTFPVFLHCSSQPKELPEPYVLALKKLPSLQFFDRPILVSALLGGGKISLCSGTDCDGPQKYNTEGQVLMMSKVLCALF